MFTAMSKDEEEGMDGCLYKHYLYSFYFSPHLKEAVSITTLTVHKEYMPTTFAAVLSQ